MDYKYCFTNSASGKDRHFLTLRVVEIKCSSDRSTVFTINVRMNIVDNPKSAGGTGYVHPGDVNIIVGACFNRNINTQLI